MLSRLRLSPQKLWWVLMILPSLLILNGWVCDALVCRFITGQTGSTFAWYFWWDSYDLGLKWIVSVMVAAMLVFDGAQLRPLGRSRSRDPWLLAIALLSLETVMRVQLNGVLFAGFNPRWHSILFDAGVFQWVSQRPFSRLAPLQSTLLWGTRPPRAFLVAAFIFSMWQTTLSYIEKRRSISVSKPGHIEL